MNFKELLFIISIALVASWTFDYFFMRKTVVTVEEAQSGQSFVAPKHPEALKPINTEINFLDVKRSVEPVETEIETKHANLVFSTDGAVLTRLEFKRKLDGYQQVLTTIFPLVNTEKQKATLLVAFDQETPFYFDLVDSTDTQDTIELTYKATWSGNTVRKKFIIFKDTHQIDLE